MGLCFKPFWHRGRHTVLARRWAIPSVKSSPQRQAGTRITANAVDATTSSFFLNSCNAFHRHFSLNFRTPRNSHDERATAHCG